MEQTTGTAPQGILRLRANKATHLRSQRGHTPPTPATEPTQHRDTATDDHATASSSHDAPRSYFPTRPHNKPGTSTDTDKSGPAPTTAATSSTQQQPERRPASVDTRRLRQNQPDRLPQDTTHQQPSLQDGRTIGRSPAPCSFASPPTDTNRRPTGTRHHQPHATQPSKARPCPSVNGRRGQPSAPPHGTGDRSTNTHTANHITAHQPPPLTSTPPFHCPMPTQPLPPIHAAGSEWKHN